MAKVKILIAPTDGALLRLLQEGDQLISPPTQFAHLGERSPPGFLPVGQTIDVGNGWVCLVLSA